MNVPKTPELSFGQGYARDGSMNARYIARLEGLAAQQLREETRAGAAREAQVIVREAQAEAQRILDGARASQGEVERQSADVQRQFQAYVAGFRALLERQLAELRALDGQRDG